jgi:hypothetical protein
MKEYEIYYPSYNVRQRKILISHSIYENYREMPYDNETQIKEAKKYLKLQTKGQEWFTDQSPFFDAISTGFVKCSTGFYPCIVKEINYDNS